MHLTRNITSLLTLVLTLALAGWSMASTVVIGKLGQTTQSKPIYASPNPKSRVYHRAKPFEYLIVRPSKYSKWLQVVMQNRRMGYIEAAAVARLPYDVKIDQVAPSASRGSGVSRATNVDRTSLPGYALEFVGTPYKWGGNDLRNGIDCSGFVKQLYGQVGLNLPRTASEQALVGQPITRLEHLMPGDRLYFWEDRRGKIGHTGIYMGNGYFVHSSSGKGGVSTDFLDTPKWRKILVAARR